MAGSQVTAWPNSFKTVGINNISCAPYATTSGSEMGFKVFPPLFIYNVTGLRVHFRYSFNASVPTVDQLVTGVYVRDIPPNTTYGVNNFIPLNIAAVAGAVDITLDLTTIVNPTGANVIYFQFPASVATSGNGTLVLLKADMLYQVQGTRDQK